MITSGLFALLLDDLVDVFTYLLGTLDCIELLDELVIICVVLLLPGVELSLSLSLAYLILSTGSNRLGFGSSLTLNIGVYIVFNLFLSA